MVICVYCDMKNESARLSPPSYTVFLGGIQTLLLEARRISARSINSVLVATHWELGRRIVNFQQNGKKRAGYGEELLEHLSEIGRAHV